MSAPALLDQARLLLLGPLGEISSAGEQTMAAAGVGYSCILSLGAACSDSGRLLPAIPGVTYVAEFSLRLGAAAGRALDATAGRGLLSGHRRRVRAARAPGLAAALIRTRHILTA